MTHLKGAHWKVYCEVPAGKLEKFMAATVGPYHIELGDFVSNATKNVSGANQPPTNGKRRYAVGPNDIWAFNTNHVGDRPSKSQNQIGRTLHYFEQLEAKNGIGEVTRRMLTARLQKDSSIGSPSSVITIVVAEGWLERADA